MKTLLKLCLLSLCVPFAAHAAAPTEQDAIAMVQKALAYSKTNGTAQLVEAVNSKSPEFVEGELYVMIINSADSVLLADPTNEQLIGINVLEMQDVDGTEFGKDLLEVADVNGKGWVGFVYKNPITNRSERKRAYVEKFGDIYAVAGIYQH